MAAAQTEGSTLSSEPVPLVPGSSIHTGTPGSSFNPEDPFYATPAEIPSQPGTVIRTQPAPHALDVTGAPGPGQATKILYSTRTQDDKPITASGYVIEPVNPWQGPGPVPTLVFAPGTRGQADVCAPSRAAGLVANADLRNGAININYELPTMYLASALGMRVVSADLIGLGTPGMHTYMNRAEQAHAILDAARAGLAAAGVPADSPVGLYGYSQGGGASAAGAELAGEYAPDLNMKGSYAGAVPADLSQVVNAVDSHLIAGVLGYTLNGYLERRPDLAYLKDEYFNDKGKAFLEATKDRCIIDSAVTWGLTDTRTLTKTGESFGELLQRLPELHEIIEEQRIGKRPLNAPMMVVAGRHDDTIPYGQVRDMAKSYCEQGGKVWFVTDETPEVLPKSALNHAIPMLAETPASLAYMVNRFKGEPAPSNCGEF